MRVGLYFSLGLVITLAIFSFMRYLINVDQTALENTDTATFVEIFRPPPRVEPEPEPEPEPETADEPSMESLTVSAPSPKPSAQVENLLPTIDLGSISVKVGPVGDSWSVPVSGTGNLKGLLDGGADNQGYIEVIPYSTGQPNIPDLAWQNKINGWVLVVFTITRTGHTKNIRVLDANPKGVFEENVVKAVSRWRYEVKSLGDYRGDMVLTQKIELFWKDYPNNLPTL